MKAAHDDTSARLGPWRRLDLIHRGTTFLRRRGIDLKLFGIYVHHIDGPDPGLDMHDHPWAFLTWIVRGGYGEQHADARTPVMVGHRYWRRWSIHRMRQTEIHRITNARPRTVTLVLRGRKTRPWGFYVPAIADDEDGPVELTWVDQAVYDYAARRPVSETRS